MRVLSSWVKRVLATLLRMGRRSRGAFWGWALVRNDSMLPTLRPGDRLLVSYRRRPSVGDVVVASFPDGILVVKRAAERRTTGWWLLSDNQAVGVDSRHRGTVADDDVRAVVVGRAWPRPTLRL
ncbi:S26 family signal peptidase [Nocardioides lijunqiniae]|uniref:S26 family signal peptidase n=1 Tax=Nocardioides lijunqiniae TaxID=2760832 RepID=UPI001D0C9C7D|nr:S26 family signal peptidase [Nocardioides lijunqiniae]